MSRFALSVALATSIWSAAAASEGGTSTTDHNDLEQRWLNAHNIERQRLGQAPLRWSQRLAEDARAWANHMANTGKFDHYEAKEGDEVQGENLWMGTRSAYSPEAMVGGWIAERRHYKTGFFPYVSRTGNWQDVGHYTQLIWHNTREVGCALSSNREDDYLVCRYFPVGNWDEQDPLGRLSTIETVLQQ